MKRCPICSKQFPDDANFCPTDAGRLELDAGATAVGHGAAAAGPAMVGGRFELGARLGGSRTGEVFRAIDQQSGQPCAVKFVDSRVFPTPLLVQRTERELKQLEKVTAPEVARILGHGKQGEQLWIATELCSGQTLDKLVATGGRLQGPRAVAIAQAIGRGLAEAARSGVIHRDLSPKNVLVGAGDEVKLINFGVPVPHSDKIQGVVEYVSPEEADGKPIDQRANLYSLGAVLYFCLTGRPPHQGSAEEVLRARLSAVPTPPSSLAPVSAPLEAVVMKALEQASARRYMTLQQMIDALGLLGDAAQPTMMGDASRGGSAAAAQTMIGLGALRGQTPPVGVSMAAAAALPAPVASPAATAQAAPPPVAAVAAVAAQAAAPAGGKAGKKKPVDDAASKGKFRETMWFKKGELDEAAAAAAAAAKEGEAVADKADLLPIEDRYKDDGTLSSTDRDRLSLRTGSTTMMQAMKAPARPAGDVSEEDLVGEMKKGRGLIIAAIILGVIGAGVVIALLAT